MMMTLKRHVYVTCTASPVRTLILQQSLGLLLTNNDSFDLRWVHVDVELPAHQEANCGCKFGLGF